MDCRGRYVAGGEKVTVASVLVALQEVVNALQAGIDCQPAGSFLRRGQQGQRSLLRLHCE